ncbi:MAG: LysR family transcriptional regulator [Candidatus Acidiferrales bacterium]
MNLHQLHYFVAVSEELSFTRAARRLGMAQPPLSRQIQALEHTLGVQLFERHSSKVFLTDAGRRFLDAARTVLQEVDDAVSIARQGKDGALGTIRVGFGKGLGDVVSAVITSYIRLYPNVDIDVRDVLSGFQADALKTRKIDIGFSHGRPSSPDLISETLFREGLTVVVPRSSRLAKRPRLGMRDLAAQNLLLIERVLSPVVHDTIAELCRDARIDLNLIHTDTTCYDEAGALTIASGRGITIAVGRSPAHPAFRDRLAAVPLRERSAWIEVCVIRRKEESAPTILNLFDGARKSATGTAVVPGLCASSRKSRQRADKS